MQQPHSQEDRGDPMMGRHDPPPLVSKLRPASVLPSDEGSGVPTDKSWPQTVLPTSCSYVGIDP